MMGSLYYEVTASGRRVALCVDKQDADQIAHYWHDGQVREAHVLIMDNPQPVEPNMTYTWTLQTAHAQPEAKRKEEGTQP